MIDDVEIPKDIVMMLGISAVHKNPHYYENPEEFRPERFDPKSKWFLNP
jgi:cytochrome P450